MISAASKLQLPWTVEQERYVPGLEVILLKQSYVLPWSQFLYAEGTDNRMRAVFSTHELRITGSGLSPLLSAFAAQQLTCLREPARLDKFTGSGPCIASLTVTAAG